MDWGEHPEESLKRELKEKTGLKGSIEQQLGVDSAVYEPSEFNGFTSLHMVRIIYRVSTEGTLQVNEIDDTTADAAWLPLSNVGDLPSIDLVSRSQAMAAGNGFRSGS